jgi:hypothetical protein
VVVEHPLGETLEPFVIEVACAVEPRPGRTRDTDSVAAIDDVLLGDHVRASQDDAPSDRGPVVRHHHVRDIGPPDVPEPPEAGGGDAGHDGERVGRTGRCTSCLERVR